LKVAIYLRGFADGIFYGRASHTSDTLVAEGCLAWVAVLPAVQDWQ